jgi:hypothetical protein
MSLSPLSDITEISKILLYYEKNKNKNWSEWLSYHNSFSKQGKQGLTGLIKLDNLDAKKNKCVFKISQYINHLVQHESTIMAGLNEIAAFCPHFCKYIGTINTKIDPKSRKVGNPFNIETKYPIEKEVLLCDYIDKSYKLYNYIKASNEKINENILYSTIKQVLLATSIAQKKKKFTHYDLHSFNVMMKRCHKDLVFLYVLDEENQFAIPTLGHYPIIIDFGFSYIENLDDGPLWPSMGHTNVGFTSDRFDWVSDPKLFLVTVSNEIKSKRATKKSHKFRRIVKNLFHPLKIDWESGWDEGIEYAASDHILELVSEYNPGSVLFKEYEHYCIDLVLTLIILPLEEQDYTSIHQPYESFVTEFLKIENQISSPFYNLYILKGIVDSARFVRAGYMEKSTRQDALKTFRNQINDKVQEVVTFCKLTGLNFEIMLCSLLNFSRDSEGVLYDIISTRMAEKEQEYKKLPLKSCEQIFAAIEVNLPSEYNYNENTKIVILDTVNENCSTFELPKDQIENINKIHDISKGTYIFDLFKNK